MVTDVNYSCHPHMTYKGVLKLDSESKKLLLVSPQACLSPYLPAACSIMGWKEQGQG